MGVVIVDTSAKKTTSDSDMHSNELITEIFEWLYSLINVFEKNIRKVESATGLSKNHALAIKAISRTPSISVSELAKRMDINTVTMVRILDRLENLEIITRIRSIKDRRVVEIKITEKANDLERILDNMTRDALMCFLGATDNNDLAQKLAPLRLFTAHVDTAESLQFGKSNYRM